MSWYCKKPDGQVYGPVLWPTFQRWAADGRVAPHDQISEDRECWVIAQDLAELHMDWMVELEDGVIYGPLHLLSIRHLLDDGAVRSTGALTNRHTGEVLNIGDTLLSVLAQQNDQLKESVTALNARLQEAEHERGEYQERFGAATGDELQQNVLREWKAAADRKDHFEREMMRWRSRYQDLEASTQTHGEQLEEELRETRQEELAAKSNAESLQLKVTQLERHLELVRESTVVGEDGAASASAQISSLLDSYNNLSRNFDAIMVQLSQKSQELNSLMESRSEIESRADQRVQYLEGIKKREQRAADESRRKLAEMEESHLQLVRSFRDLNDRYIRLRQHTLTNEPQPPVQQVPSQKPDDQKKGWKPKVKLSKQ